MSTENKSWFGKYWKQLLLVLVVVFLVFYVAVFHQVWADRNYKTNFWPNFFMWSGIIVGGGMFVAWLIGWIGQNRRR